MKIYRRGKIIGDGKAALKAQLTPIVFQCLGGEAQKGQPNLLTIDNDVYSYFKANM